MEWFLSLPCQRRHSPYSGPAGSLLTGIALITGAVCLLSFSDALVKLAGASYSLGQLMVLRSLVAAGFIIATMIAGDWRLAIVSLLPSRWVWLRSLCLAVMWLCYYAALPEMSFALAAACYYTAPVWIALFARLSGAEKVDPRRWTGIGLALAGVVIAVDPWGTAVETVVVLPLGAAVFYAIAAVITGRRCADERALVMALNLNCVLAAGGAVGLAALALSGAARPGEFVAGLWPALSLGDWLLVLVLGLFLALIAIAVAEAYRAAPASIIGVFDNGYLLFAALWSVLLFDVLPSPWEAAGLGLIAAGAVLATLRARPPGPLRQAI